MKRQALKFRLKDKMRNRYALTNEQTNGWIGRQTYTKAFAISFNLSITITTKDGLRKKPCLY
jgi:hypothetical protein